MLIDIRQLKDPIRIEIQGQEDWLQALYDAFPTEQGNVMPQIKGTITVCAEASGDVLLSGNLVYAPYVNCGRCDLAILWPLRFEAQARYRQMPKDTPDRERELTAAEMDISFLEDYNLDLGQAILEQVLLTLPSQTTKVSENTGCCEICGDSVTEEEVYRDPEADKQNPFAALQSLKFEQDDEEE